jgi:hypothetical protein
MLGLDLWPFYLVTALSGLMGLVLLLLPVRGSLRWMRRHRYSSEKQPKRPRLSMTGAEVLGGITLLSIAVAAISLMIALTSYRAMAEKTLCAEVVALPVKHQKQRIMLEFTPVVDGHKLPKQVFFLDGDQWRVEGHILRWAEWTRFLGLKTCYRLTRIDGRFSSVAQASERRPTVVGLADEADGFWNWMHEEGYALPGVESVWGGGAYHRAEENVIFQVWVTPGGYMIKRK